MTGSCRRKANRGTSRLGAAPFANRLVIMAKEPVAGATKTRLARAIGAAIAMRFARQTTAAVLQRLAHNPRWQTILAVSPDTAIASRHWPHWIACVTQGGGDLGRRMQRIIERLPPGPVAIIGTDVPGIRPGHIAEAFRQLGRRDAVFGPAEDGGYWLVGLKRRPRLLKPFVRVRWSSEHALSDTLANLRGCEVGFVASLRDVDDAQDYTTASRCLGRRVLPAACPADAVRRAR